MNAPRFSLNALRAFEAAARLQSHTAAAQELGVTQGAISRQIQVLESWLACKLFVRDRQGVQATAAARELCVQATAWFDQIEQATQRIKSPRSSRQLRIKLPPTFAIQWLVPRLARFHARHPEIEVQITTSHHRTDWHTEDVDISIRSEADSATEQSSEYENSSFDTESNAAYSDARTFMKRCHQSITRTWPECTRYVQS